MIRAGAAVAAVVAIGLGCGSMTGPPDGLTQSIALSGCGPADGAATVIYLARDPMENARPSSFPYVQLTIWQDVTQLAGKRWRVDSSGVAFDASLARALYVTGPGTFEIPRHGSVTVDRVAADHRIDGNVNLEFSPRDVVGTFSARWVQLAVLCG